MRLTTALVFAMTMALGSAARAQVESIDQVDLGTPGTLEKLRASNPGHYAKIAAILSYVESGAFVPSAPKVIETRFDAVDVTMLQWKVSYPPKLRVAFTLDSTRYSAEVVTTPSDRPMRASRDFR